MLLSLELGYHVCILCTLGCTLLPFFAIYFTYIKKKKISIVELPFENSEDFDPAHSYIQPYMYFEFHILMVILTFNCIDIRSCVKKGYMKDDNIHLFVRRPVRRSPIINRGMV
jgi:hypothetical protein